MTDFYNPAHRTLQAEFATARLANHLETAIITDTLDPSQTAFIDSRNAFFVSTLGEDGWPTVSYKGGAAGFVRAPDD
jgi:hypothetical protein|tara:strand:+ start:3760 stop:3990 length:231 start_codon:yes stop_codon:yes gene_type:complete